MRSLLFTLVLIAAVGTSTVAQTKMEDCGSIPTEAERLRYAAEMDLVSNLPTRYYEDNTLKVVMYRLRESNGTGARSDGEFAEEINNLNSYYSSHGICFSLMRIVNIDNTAYLDTAKWNNPPTADSMKNAIANENPWFNDAMTIYVLPPSVWFRGSSYGIPSTALIMTSNTNGKWGTAHIAHEMGHCLGNFHTHDDSGGAFLELVDRFCPAGPFFDDQGAWWDCCSGGDHMCSTPADPQLSGMTSYGTWKVDPNTCTYQDTAATDVVGNLFAPDVTNIMSYAWSQCRSTFSWEQINRHHITLDLNLDFSAVQAPHTFLFGDATYSSGYAHLLSKDSTRIIPGTEYRVDGSAQILHQTDGLIRMEPGFVAAPSDMTGYFIARATNVCDNDTLQLYAFPNSP